MKAKKFEQQFDQGVDITASLDLSKARRVQQAQKRVNVDFPTWMIDSLDREASKLGVTRQSVIKVWLAERLEATASIVPTHTATAYIALGANLGNARAAVLQAMQDLGSLPQTTLLRTSSLYRSAPVDASGPDFINAVAEISTTLSPQALLTALQVLELGAGRQRPYRNAPRTLDLDILLYDALVLDSPTLVIPHPRMLSRAFVLLPLSEIAPEQVTPEQLQAVSGQAIVRMVL